MSNRSLPPERFVIVSCETDGCWTIDPRYESSPLNTPLAYEYLGDVGFIPVYWKNIPDTEDQREELLTNMSGIIDNSQVVTPHYIHDGANAIYLVTETGEQILQCLVGQWGDANAIVYALNHTFPSADTSAFQQRERENVDHTANRLLQHFRQPHPDE